MAFFIIFKDLIQYFPPLILSTKCCSVSPQAFIDHALFISGKRKTQPMCGISAIINSTGEPISRDALKKMSDLIRHRGPDGEGYFIEGTVGLGHRMLKILDLGSANVQPMRFKNYVVCHNGEIYNFREIREQLKQLGYEFKTQTDTEVVLAAYDAWREDCVHRFNGMWAFVLYDQISKRVFASRDRFGIKPLCYTQINKKFVIASEIKQFTAFSDFNARLNQKAAFEFLYNGNLNTSQDAMLENVQFLAPGSNLLYDLPTQSFKIKKWYQPSTTKKNLNLTLRDAIAEFRNLFSQSVHDHLHSRVSLGSSLSGGLDSSSIVGVATKSGVCQKTYSSCIQAKEYNEVRFIEAAVNAYGVPNYKIFPDVHDLTTKNELDKLVYQQDQPILSGSFFSEFKVYQLAARHGTRVILGGGGADEYLGGYGEFYDVFLKSLLGKKKLLSYANEFLQLPQLKIRSVAMLRLMYQKLIANNPRATNGPRENCLRKEWLTKNFPQYQKPNDKKDVDELSLFALINYSLPHQLHSEDRNSMNFSIESRLPYLDHRLVEFCLSLPDNYKLRNGTTKYILRESMRPVLPAIIYKRRIKLGFPGPEAPIFKSAYSLIKERFKSLLQNFPELFSNQLVTTLRDYVDEKLPYDNFLFRALAFEAWARSFNVSSSTAQNISERSLEKVSERVADQATSY
jgi:asparagine synthase (glutamine-hydrolysing)